MRPEWDTLRENVQAGAEWVMNTKQTAPALITHFGDQSHCGGGLSVMFTPGGWHESWKLNLKGLGVVVFQLSHPYNYLRGDDRIAYSPEAWPEQLKPEPFTEAEFNEFGELIAATGLKIIQRWNGPGLDSGSYGVQGVNPSLERAHKRYQKGCPKHGSVFCGWGSSHTDDGEPCDWFSENRAKIVKAAWVPGTVPSPESNGDRSADDDSNLRIIREVLARTRGDLAELSIVNGLVVAGRRGDIEEGPDRLEFVDKEGHGVLLPAEVFETLLDLAKRGYEVR